MNTQMKEYVQWRVTSWPDAIDIANRMGGWLFRGQQSIQWELTSSLERVAEAYGYQGRNFQEIETEIINQFKRQAHHFVKDPPKAEETLEWLSILQHHGAPTRLLDVSESFYVATFFAVENACEDSVVWAFDPLHFRSSENEQKLQIDYDEDVIRKYVEEKLWKPGVSQVVGVRPYRLNERLIVQQGSFLCPLGGDVTFQKCLCETLGLTGDRLPDKAEVVKSGLIELLNPCPDTAKLVKFVLPAAERVNILRDLRRMNISAASLFPGLDGFARSLKFQVQQHMA